MNYTIMTLPGSIFTCILTGIEVSILIWFCIAVLRTLLNSVEHSLEDRFSSDSLLLLSG